MKDSIPSQAELDQAEKVKTNLENDLKKLLTECSGLETQKSLLQEKIMEVGGVKLRLLKSEIDDITGEIELIQSRLSNQVLDKARKENELKKNANLIKETENEIDNLRSDSSSSQQALETQMLENRQLEQQIEELRVEIEKLDDAIGELKTRDKEQSENVNKFKLMELELTNQMENLSKSIAERERAKQNYIKEIRKLELHSITDVPDIIDSKKKHTKNSKEFGDNADIDDEDENANDEYINVPTDNDLNEVQQLREYSPEELEDVDVKELETEIAKLSDGLDKVSVNMDILKEYKSRAAEYQSRFSEAEEATARRESLKKHCQLLRKQRHDEFLQGFKAISFKLKEMYQLITMGGNAELELVDSLDPFTEGILFSVMPPKKSWKNISNLSGGEKTLSSLALVFALHHYKPTPLYVMDEIDAALDFKNVSIVANYIKQRTKNGQFIVISLRNNMFELANQLVGIYKVNNMTKCVALKNA